AEEDGRERPRAGDEWPARQGGAPERESAQHDETPGEEEGRHQQGSRWGRVEQGLAVLLRNGHIGPPTSSAGPIHMHEAEGEQDTGGRYANETDHALLGLRSCYRERPVRSHLDRIAAPPSPPRLSWSAAAPISWARSSGCRPCRERGLRYAATSPPRGTASTSPGRPPAVHAWARRLDPARPGVVSRLR